MQKKIIFICMMAIWIHPFGEANAGDIFIDSGQALGDAGLSAEVVLWDLDGDGDMDAYVTQTDGWDDIIWLNNGKGVFIEAPDSPPNIYGNQAALGDLDGDLDPDLFCSNYNAPTYYGNRVFLNNGQGQFSDSGQALGNLVCFGAATGDLDGDGDLDGFLSNTGPNTVWLNNGAGVFTDSGQALGNNNSLKSCLGDLDGDNDLDVLTANSGTGNRVYLNSGSGFFTDSGQALGSGETRNIALGDVDGDGDLDAYMANMPSADTVWLNNGSGVFTNSSQNLGTGKSRSVALGDVDGDGDLDALVAKHDISESGNILYLNNGAGIFSDSGLRLGNSKTTGIALGDVDGDGDLDAFEANDLGEPDKVWLNTSNKKGFLPAIFFLLTE